MDVNEPVAGIVFAAGKGSRMVGYDGNKTLLPLIAHGREIYRGERPLLLEVLRNLPAGPKGIVVHHRAEEVRDAVQTPDVSFLYQPVTNGTGGALLAARTFLEAVETHAVVITMGDVPLIRAETYQALVRRLDGCDLVLLAFEPRDRAQYGLLDTEGDRVRRIVEWKYWRHFPSEQQDRLRFCNAGVYAARRSVLLGYMDTLAARGHSVQKEWDGKLVTIQEYFITDLVEMMHEDGRLVGMVPAAEEEVTGVDTPEALRRVQGLYAGRNEP